MNNVIEKINELTELAKQLNVKEIRIINDKTVPLGKVFRQGDLYIFHVPMNHEVGEEINIRQLADGISMGARHILKGNVRVYVGVKHPNGVNNRYPLGYAFDVDDAVLEHPEHAHGDICYNKTTRFQVVHQMDMITMRKVSD